MDILFSKVVFEIQSVYMYLKVYGSQDNERPEEDQNKEDNYQIEGDQKCRSV